MYTYLFSNKIIIEIDEQEAIQTFDTLHTDIQFQIFV